MVESPSPAVPCQVSVIVVNWNTRELTCECLASVVRATRGCSYEIIVVDNGSSDGSVEQLRRDFPDAVLVSHARNLGFAAGCNGGMRRARGRYYLLLNSDTRLDQDAVSALARELDGDPGLGLAGAALRYPDGRPQPSCGRFPTLGSELLSLVRLSDLWGKLRGRGPLFPAPFLSFRRHAQACDVDWVAGACMLVRREAVEQVGPMDDNIFLFAEEWDWCYRLRRAGWRIRHAPQASLIHVGSASMVGDEAWRVRSLLDGYCYFFRKHGGRWHALGFQGVTAFASSLKCLVWGLMLLPLVPSRRARDLCARRLRWNLNSVRWALAPGKRA